MFGNVLKNTWGKNIMIKRNGQRIAAIAMTVALMGQNVSPIFSLESLKGIETVTSENEAKAEELAPQDQYEETELSEVEKLKQKIAELEAKVNSKPKEVKGLFDDADLKKSEKKITDNLDKMTGKSPQDLEQTELF